MSRPNLAESLSAEFSNLAITHEASSASRIQGRPFQRATRSPIDDYFLGYASRPGSKFTYDPNAKNINIIKTFNRLANANKWRGERRSEEKEKFFEAIDLEFTTIFGDGNDIQTWQRLLVMFGHVGKIPKSITKCRKKLSRYYVNIYDFVHYCRRVDIFNDEGGERDLRFLNKGSLQNLRSYSKPDKLYPLDRARGNVLKAFLVHMF